MPSKLLLPQLPARLQKLIEERQHHADALARIDQILSSIGAAMGAAIVHRPIPKAEIVPAATPPAVAKTRNRRKQKKFATSAAESIIAFVKQNKNPTTSEIKKLWKTEGRGGRAENVLGIMVKAKKLKRTPLGEGMRGSRYTLA